MRTFVRRALQTVLVSGGLVVAGAAAAQADPLDDLTAALGGILDGTAGDAAVAEAPVTAPVNVSGVSVAVLGDAEGAGEAQQPTAASGSSDGTLADAPVTAPVNVSGVSVAVLGDAGSAGEAQQPAAGSSSDGTAVQAPVTAPVTISGLSLALLGDAEAAGEPAPAVTAPAGESTLLVPVTAPVTITGTSLSVLGDAGTVAPGAGPGDPGPGTPTDPGTPPADPGTGGPLTPVVAPVVSGLGALDATGLLAAGLAPSALASTGGELLQLLGLAALLLVTGVTLRASHPGSAIRRPGGLPQVPTQRGPERR
jgi:hypothetical protein